jgi:hypothetical protein
MKILYQGAFKPQSILTFSMWYFYLRCEILLLNGN